MFQHILIEYTKKTERLLKMNCTNEMPRDFSQYRQTA